MCYDDDDLNFLLWYHLDLSRMNCSNEKQYYSNINKFFLKIIVSVVKSYRIILIANGGVSTFQNVPPFSIFALFTNPISLDSVRYLFCVIFFYLI